MMHHITSSGRRWAASTALALTLVLVSGGVAAHATPADATSTHSLSATPTPKITGTARVGSPLVAIAGTWKPEGVLLSYSWSVNGIAVETAHEATFFPSPEHKGARVTVTVTGELEGYAPVARTSAKSSSVAAGVLSGSTPTVEGTRRVGETLFASAGAWAPEGATLSYQWQRNGKSIKGATSPTLQLTAPDKSTVITVVVRAALPGYTTASKTSSKKVAKVAAGLIVSPAAASIEGTVAVGSPVSVAFSEPWPAGVSVSYQWRVSGKAVTKATAATFTPSAGQLGKPVSVVVTGKRSGYTSSAITAPATAPVVEGTFSTVPSPLTSSSVVGRAITVTPGVTAPKATSYAYQWLRNGDAVPGATKATFTPRPTDLGATITVDVTYRAAGIVPVVASSTPGAPVAPGTLTANVKPKISGTARVGSKLSASLGTWSAGVESRSVQWFVGGVAVDGATASSFTIRPRDVDRAVTIQVTATGQGYSAATASSASTKSVVGKVYSLCAYLNADYPDGVRKSGISGDMKSGTLRAFVGEPFVSNSVYNLNKAKRDADKDGIACER